MADMFTDEQLRYCIRQVIENHGEITPSDESMWFTTTRRMFMKYPTIQVWEQVEMALEEASDKQWFENKFPKEIFMEKFVEPTKEKIIRKNSNNPNTITAKISAKISIIGIADKYGLRPLGKPKRICPFHNDSQPSLSLSDERGLFNCFSGKCSAKGNIIDFIYLLRKYDVGGIENGK